MNRLLYILFLFAFVSSCSTEVVNDDTEPANETEVDIPANKMDAESTTKEYLFESDEEGVKEFMRCTENADGSHGWVYFSANNENEVKLGVREEAGFEVVYFYGKPKELYWIYGSECGFTLSDDTRKSSQWYGQVKPRCADDMFENE